MQRKRTAKYCYVTHELRLHQNDRCKRFSLVYTIALAMAPFGLALNSQFFATNCEGTDCIPAEIVG